MTNNLLLAMVCVTGMLQAQSPVARPVFEVATIKPSADTCNGPGGGGPMGPGRLSMPCTTAQYLIQLAFGTLANGSAAGPDLRSIHVIGAPKWLESDHYDLVAKAEGDAAFLQMAGPMLQALLEDRLKLKLHRETRQLPVYVLTIAKNGSKLQPFQDGSCTPIEKNVALTASPTLGQTPPCRATSRRNGTDMMMDISGMSVAFFAGQILSSGMDRPVIDRTGLSGLFDFHVRYASDLNAMAPGAAPTAGDASGPSIFTALQDQLGLKLSPDTGPVEVLVVDHVEKPSEN